MPERMPSAAASLAELVERVSTILVGPTDVPTLEQALDGLVRHAHHDREALAGALKPMLASHTWARTDTADDGIPAHLGYVAQAALGTFTAADITHAYRDPRSPLGGKDLTPFGTVLAARFVEAAHQLVTGPPPFLLATPSHLDGTIEPADLVARLSAYEHARVEPGDIDFSQALLRLHGTASEQTIAAANALRSDHGHRLAHWLHAGGPAFPRPTPTITGPGRSGLSPTWLGVRRLLAAVAATTVPTPVSRPLNRLLKTLHAGDGVPELAAGTESTEHWPAVIPTQPDLVATWCLSRIAVNTIHNRSGTSPLLTALVRSRGPAGSAVHLAVGYALGAQSPDDRAGAVDATLLLSDRGELDPAMLGRQLADLVGLKGVKPTRLATALTDLTHAGAHDLVWDLLAAALPGLLSGAPAPGLAGLVAIASHNAELCGARGVIPQVAQLSAHSTGRLKREAHRLHTILTSAS
ncbi:DUF7824 domain-containing protein [Actinocatenispora rupis]|uniref:DUF7824 domain-containing protein n=1 Tax=Actinocatenispora rupis TaxID=519421 RepID=A0A8J3NGY9_9ACTN|nr:DUF6493 family protein [Actinocatenispora rupis]GID15389.1 hypothetical protein Aru02nite_62780 [Actinocatenispora rupis]